ncbi:hypothetical protein [Clostridium senegalense]|uniref:hypothetical protein n=1 Tax=Clostridium senegalense TaxID=1465809 RepID=UPI000288BB01|nr:hypothetical protein [Clostridium senegalense]
MSYDKFLRTNDSIKGYKYIKRKIDNIDEDFIINGFQYWCVFREIDAIACAVYILEVLDDVENLKEIPYLEKSYNYLYHIVDREEIFNAEEEGIYNKILDIASILKYANVYGKSGCDLNKKSLQYTLKGIIDEIKYFITSFKKK